MSAPAEDLGAFSLYDLFRGEVEQHVAALEQGLVGLEAAPDDLARIEPLMRAAHSLKGAARIVGLADAVSLAHAMEDLLVAAQERRVSLGAAAVDGLLAGTDVLRRLGSLPEAEAAAFLASPEAGLEGLVARLRHVESGASPSPEASPAAPPSAPQAPVPPEASVPGEAPQPPAPPAAGTGATAPPRGAASVRLPAGPVRVSAEGLTRMLAYAGEGVVQARRLAAHAGQLEGLRRSLDRLVVHVERTAERLRRESLGARAREAFQALRAEVGALRQEMAARSEALDLSVRQGADVAGRLYREVLESRLRPFGEGLAAYPRLVRDLARELGKRARLEVVGRDVPVDRDILEALDAPLTHMVRNALDHGLEGPEERQAKGKEPVGMLRVAARHHAGMLEIRVADDGRGVDLASVRRRIVERGMVMEEIARSFTEDELLEFLFLPGFSTAAQVTEVSGRGVGLDVVQTMAREAGGHVRVERRATGGTAFVMTLPITRSVVRVALVEIAGDPYALPLTQIDRIVRVEPAEVLSVESRPSFSHDGRIVGLVPAAEVLGARGGALPGDALTAVVVRGGRDVYGLVVDRYVGEQTLDVRALDARLGKVANVSAAALDDRGDPILILDVQDLLRSVDQLLHEGGLKAIRAARGRRAEAAGRVRRILVVDDSITVREVERKLLANRGYAVDVCVDGMDAWNAVRSQAYDLVLTDVDMPRMDGIELVQKIRGDARLARLPVMIVSYKDRPEDRMRGLEAGANAYVTKSAFHEDALVREVTHLIGDPRASAPEGAEGAA